MSDLSRFERDLYVQRRRLRTQAQIGEQYRQLEEDMLQYKDYASIKIEPRDEPLVPIVGEAALQATLVRADAMPITGSQVFVRQGLLGRLRLAAATLALRQPGTTLDVGYGYRAPSVQQSRFDGQVNTLCAQFPEKTLDDIYAMAHRQVARPEVGGHPAGAAVDITMRGGSGELLDLGTDLWEFTRESYTFAPNISPVAKANRLLLRSVMQDAGFAPFNGEWWHFSYGDREWARYYNQPTALYEKLEFRATDTTNV